MGLKIKKQLKKALPEILISLGLTAVTAIISSDTVKQFFKNLLSDENDNGISLDDVSDYMGNHFEPEPIE